MLKVRWLLRLRFVGRLRSGFLLIWRWSVRFVFNWRSVWLVRFVLLRCRLKKFVSWVVLLRNG